MIVAFTYNDHDDNRDVKVSLYAVYDVTCHTEKFTGWCLMILIFFSVSSNKRSAVLSQIIERRAFIFNMESRNVRCIYLYEKSIRRPLGLRIGRLCATSSRIAELRLPVIITLGPYAYNKNELYFFRNNIYNYGPICGIVVRKC